MAKTHITSPLLDDTNGMPAAAVDDDALLAFITPENASSDLIGSQQPATTGTSAEGRSKTSKTKTSAAINDGNAVILGPNGEDVSDYV